MIFQGMIFFKIKRQHLHFKPVRHTNHMLSNMAGANHSNSLSFQIKSTQPTTRQASSFSTIHRANNLPRQSQDESKSVLGDGVFTIKRHVGYFNSSTIAFGKVNMIKPGGVSRDKTESR